MFLAYTNGANDNFKGVATLYGSRTVNYNTAISIATIATFAGSISAIFLANGLINNFSGKGLVPQEIIGSVDFLMALGLGAALTVLIATLFGLPISTTHSLVGALFGAGLMSVGADVNIDRLLATFFIPLLASPFIALLLGAIVYLGFNKVRELLGVHKESCICYGEQKQFVPISSLNPDQLNRINVETEKNNVTVGDISISTADINECVEIYTDNAWGMPLQKLLDFAHCISAVSVSFARGLNDTPKIAGLLVAISVFNINWGMVAIAIGMAVGGLLNARRVAENMSNKITTLNHGQGFSANLVTSILVIFASKIGVPVSTTHVSVGAIFGISTISGNRNKSMIKNILFSWLFTLPIAMFLSASIYFLLSII